LRIADFLDTCGVSKQQHAVDRCIVNDRGTIDDCGDAMRSPDAVKPPIGFRLSRSWDGSLSAKARK
jgi:hypothetical protein